VVEVALQVQEIQVGVRMLQMVELVAAPPVGLA
jgi:hypothetical protein